MRPLAALVAVVFAAQFASAQTVWIDTGDLSATKGNASLGPLALAGYQRSADRAA